MSTYDTTQLHLLADNMFYDYIDNLRTSLSEALQYARNATCLHANDIHPNMKYHIRTCYEISKQLDTQLDTLMRITEDLNPDD